MFRLQGGGQMFLLPCCCMFVLLASTSVVCAYYSFFYLKPNSELDIVYRVTSVHFRMYFCIILQCHWNDYSL